MEKEEYWGLVKRIIEVTFQPMVFFKRVEEETGYQNVFIYYTVIQVIALLLKAISIAATDIGFLLSGWLGLIGGFIINFIWWPILVLIFHVFIRLIGGKQKLNRTYQAFLYGLTPIVLIGWIPLLGFLVGIYSVYLTIVGIYSLHKMKLWRVIIAYFLPIVILFIIFLLIEAGGTFVEYFSLLI